MFVNAFVQDGSSARVSCHEESYSHMVSSDLIAISIFWWYKLYSVPCPTINQYLHWVALTLPQTSKHQFSFVSKILLPYDQPYLDWVTLTLPYTPANIYWALCQVFSCPSINHTWIELLLFCLTHQQTSIELRMVATSTSTTIAKPQVSSVFDAIIFQHIQLFIHQ